MKKKLLSYILSLSMLFGTAAAMPVTTKAAPDGRAEIREIVLEKSMKGNPIAGFDENDDLIYAGDPSILVDGDTVYLYVGHDDAAQGSAYTMPNYLCYSTKDMRNWTYHGEIMNMKDVSWADDISAWAAQVIKYQGRYYLLYCAEQRSVGKSVAAAVADKATGPFRDLGVLVHPNMTDASKYGRPASFGHEDIDPTAWIVNEGKADEHVYMAWGNTNPYLCELEIDGASVKIKDINGDGKISQGDDRTSGDIWYQPIGTTAEQLEKGTMGISFTEAPYLYRRQNEKGEYYGKYYMFFAMNWREEMGYATSDSLEDPKWLYGGRLMVPTATSDTNHPAVFDFKGHTYFIYHNGSLAAGMGQRRVICVEELFFNEDGSIPYIPETSTGLTGFTSSISDSGGNSIAHAKFENTLKDADYPKDVNKNIAVNVSKTADAEDALWEMKPGKSDKNRDSYVSIESYNKPGCYLMAKSSSEIVLAHDHNGNAAATKAGITTESEAMTFRTLQGFAGKNGVTFESVKHPGYYLTSSGGVLTLSNGADAAACTFNVSNGTPKVHANVSSVSVQKTVKNYPQGSVFHTDDLRIGVKYDDGTAGIVKFGFTTNEDDIDTSRIGKQTLTIKYEKYGQTYTKDIIINVTGEQPEIEKDIAPVKDLPKKNSVHTVGSLKYKVTKTDEYNTDGSNGAVTVTGMNGNKASVKIPDTVAIDGYTFKVTAIGSKAFNKKNKLKTITVGSNVKSIGANAIAGINKKATIKAPSARLKAVKKLLTAKTGYKKTMKVKKA